MRAILWFKHFGKEGSVVPGRVILHADMNNCYASIEMLHHPKLRGHPVAVGGSVEERHGIILAKNYEAKAFGINVGQALWQARQLCPNLIIVPPDYDKYLRFSRLFRKILSDYSPQVEAFGLDESWVDITGSRQSGAAIADEIRERTKFELGITVSVGVSYNKIFAKFGSDIKKPDATTVISEDNFRDIVWKLPAADLLGVGRSTQIKLSRYCVRTIGDIANCNPDNLKSWFGKWGLFLWSYANGYDSSPVAEAGDEAAVKSIGNSTTCPRDLEDESDCRIVFQNLAESVAERMRELGLKAGTVEISLRRNDLVSFTRQTTLSEPTFISTELCGAAMKLLRQHYKWEVPLRSIGVRGTKLVPADSAQQLSLFRDEAGRERMERLEWAVDDIRRRFGHHAINRAMMYADPLLGKLNPKSDHTIHPVGYVNGGRSQ
jgi:DNA polymerase-4